MERKKLPELKEVSKEKWDQLYRDEVIRIDGQTAGVDSIEPTLTGDSLLKFATGSKL